VLGGLSRDSRGLARPNGQHGVRFASRDREFWELLSAEECHARNPDTFSIPERQDREGLSRGQAVKLIFEIEGEDDDGKPDIIGERMWVLVRERHGKAYLGILLNDPASFEPAEDLYLCKGAEIPFGPEHVIAIEFPPSDFVEQQLGVPPTRTWSP